MSNARLDPNGSISQTIQILRSIRSDQMKEAARIAVREGWRLQHNGNGHCALYSPNPKHTPVIFSATSNGSSRNWQNMRAELRKRGLELR